MEHQSDKAAAQAVHRRVKAVLNTPQRPLYTLAEVTFKAQGIHRDRVSADRHQLSVDKLEGGTGMVAKLVCTMPAGPTLHKHDVEVEVEHSHNRVRRITPGVRPKRQHSATTFC